MHTEMDVHAYVQDLERYLGALAEGDEPKAAWLAGETQQLALTTPGHPDMAAAAVHARGLVGQDPVTLARAAACYSSELARAGALEDAGNAWAGQGNQAHAVDTLGQAHSLYERLGADDGMARVRSRLRAAGTRLCHWRHADRPAVGWDSLTDTERRIADLVAEGLSNRQVASRVFLSPHTVAFHLRHVFWKLGVTSRVQLARMAAETAAQGGDAHGAVLPKCGTEALRFRRSAVRGD